MNLAGAFTSRPSVPSSILPTQENRAPASRRPNLMQTSKPKQDVSAVKGSGARGMDGFSSARRGI